MALVLLERHDVKYNKLIFFDTETTGFKENRIVSIGLLCYENGKRIAKENIWINPQAQIESGASKVNGFTNDMVVDKPIFNEVWGNLKEYFNEAVWVCHNAKYDEKAMLGEFNRYGLEIPNYCTLCTCENSKKLIAKSEIKNYKLDTVAQYFGINFTEEQHHDAFFDTVACMKIYNKLVQLSKGNLEVKEKGVL